jgi:hypothetical protein
MTSLNPPQKQLNDTSLKNLRNGCAVGLITPRQIFLLVLRCKDQGFEAFARANAFGSIASVACQEEKFSLSHRFLWKHSTILATLWLSMQAGPVSSPLKEGWVLGGTTFKDSKILFGSHPPIPWTRVAIHNIKINTDSGRKENQLIPKIWLYTSDSFTRNETEKFRISKF